MKPINRPVFIFFIVIFVVLTGISLIAAGAEEEGTLGNEPIWLFLARLYTVLRFPTHTLLWDLFSLGDAVLFLPGLVINCLLYALLMERVVTLLRGKRQPEE